jgi:hypothetical protein
MLTITIDLQNRPRRHDSLIDAHRWAEETKVCCAVWMIDDTGSFKVGKFSWGLPENFEPEAIRE